MELLLGGPVNGHRNHGDRKLSHTRIPSTLEALNSTEYNKCHTVCINVFVIPSFATGGGNGTKRWKREGYVFLDQFKNQIRTKSPINHLMWRLKMLPSLPRSMKWLSCSAAVQFYLQELLGDRSILITSIFWEMGPINEFCRSVMYYQPSTLVSCGLMKEKDAIQMGHQVI